MLSPANDQNTDMRLCCIHMTMISAQEYYKALPPEFVFRF